MIWLGLGLLVAGGALLAGALWGAGDVLPRLPAPPGWATAYLTRMALTGLGAWLVLAGAIVLVVAVLF